MLHIYPPPVKTRTLASHRRLTSPRRPRRSLLSPPSTGSRFKIHFIGCLTRTTLISSATSTEKTHTRRHSCEKPKNCRGIFILRWFPDFPPRFLPLPNVGDPGLFFQSIALPECLHICVGLCVFYLLYNYVFSM